MRKWLETSTVINDYNYYINAVDINNQLKALMTLIRDKETRNWRPFWLWLLDVCIVNAYLIWL
jgi:hypothetical protein